MNARFHIASVVGIGAMVLAAAGLAGCRSSAEPPSTRATAQTSPATAVAANAPPPVVEAAAAAPTVPPAQPVAPPKQASPPPPPPPKKGVTREQCRRAFTATCSARCRAKDRGRFDNTIKGRRIEADLCFAECARSAEAGCP